jgi:hypothetical protein
MGQPLVSPSSYCMSKFRANTIGHEKSILPNLFLSQTRTQASSKGILELNSDEFQ